MYKPFVPPNDSGLMIANQVEKKFLGCKLETSLDLCRFYDTDFSGKIMDFIANFITETYPFWMDFQEIESKVNLATKMIQTMLSEIHGEFHKRKNWMEDFRDFLVETDCLKLCLQNTLTVRYVKILPDFKKRMKNWYWYKYKDNSSLCLNNTPPLLDHHYEEQPGNSVMEADVDDRCLSYHNQVPQQGGRGRGRGETYYVSETSGGPRRSFLGRRSDPGNFPGRNGPGRNGPGRSGPGRSGPGRKGPRISGLGINTGSNTTIGVKREHHLDDAYDCDDDDNDNNSTQYNYPEVIPEYLFEEMISKRFERDLLLDYGGDQESEIKDRKQFLSITANIVLVKNEEVHAIEDHRRKVANCLRKYYNHQRTINRHQDQPLHVQKFMYMVCYDNVTNSEVPRIPPVNHSNNNYTIVSIHFTDRSFVPSPCSFRHVKEAMHFILNCLQEYEGYVIEYENMD